MDQNFTYQGWTFRHQTDGSLIIEPSTQFLKAASGGEVFSDKPQTAQAQMKSISIPQEEVHRLVAYCISGKAKDDQVLQSVKQLEQQYGLVGGQTR